MSDKSVAIVGTPCEIMAASKIQKYTDNSIDFKIGLFCMENFSYKYFSELLNEYDLSMVDIEKFRVEKGHVFLFLKNNNKLKIPLSEAKKVVRKNCNICVELTSETSDISVGSIGSNNGYSTVIIRTDDGEQIINNAINEGYLEANDLTQSQFALLNKISKNKSKKNSETIDFRESNSKPVLYQRDITDKAIFDEISQSNFSDLKANVIDVGACVLCGACEYICHEKLITIDNAKPRKRGKCPTDCHACFVVCPRTFIPEDLRNTTTKNLGNYKKIITVKSLKNYEGQDGAVVTTILDYLISKNIVTDALIVDKKDSLPWKPFAKITNDIDEIAKSSGTKYSVCPIFKALDNINEDVI